MKASTSARRTPNVLARLAVPALILGLTGCGLQIPTDPDGTLDRVSGGVLRVGASPNGNHVHLDGDPVAGTEVDLVEGFAVFIDADVEWTVAGEETLVRELDGGRLDLVIGGITSETPWVSHAGPTRPYGTTEDAVGDEHDLVMLVPMGENAFLSTLERYLDEQGSTG